MVVQAKDLRSGEQSDEQTMLADLRKSVNAIASDLSEIAEKRGRAVKETAEAGTSMLRQSIRRQPAVAMGVATLAGALVVLLVVPRFGRSQAASRWSATNWNDWTSPVTRADLQDFADRMQRSVTRAASAVPVAPALERLVEALSKVEAKDTFNSVLDKAGSWFQRLKEKTPAA
jgi:hypothetical protein